ncbi:peptide/nickel transport system substrate-binding protein [Leifsonia sp. AK011]|uniref:ABC transporter family substrate-binding protein n=1 Tax=Leifsonia sp. AK011 TaxID=2723075 RepID=UPI0015CC3387|nr:ABC transporter family substrate-binding protein [Leifsonia sp. AK011]NYF10159.1 peptide/nickel transport system substrate-binding protein [Leifsonia sp. AK011]
MRTRRFAVAAATLTIAALTLAGCVAPQSQVVDGSVVSVGWSQSFTSYNARTSYGNKPGNTAITSTTLSGFNYVDDVPQLVTDPSFGSYELLSEDPLVVRFTIADGVTWSDGTAIDASDLLLEWAALSGAFNEEDFDAKEFVDPESGQFTDAFPDDVVYFDSGADPEYGLGLVTETPTVSEDKKSITLAYDEPFIDWNLQIVPPLPAHVVAKNALGISDNQEAKDAVLDAIQNDDTEALAALSQFWNTGFNFTEMPDDTDLLLSSGPYVITDFIADQYVTLSVNPEYKGAHRPQAEEIKIRYISDPLAAVQAFQNGEVQVIAPQATADVWTALNGLEGTVVGGSEASFEHIDLQFDQSKSGNFNNPLIREAFLKVIPRQEILDKLIVPLKGSAELRNSQVFLPGQAGYDESVESNGSDEFLEVDVEGAKKLLAEAGATNPEVCILYSPTNPRRSNEFILIQQSAAQAGFNVTDCSSTDWRGLLGTAGAYDAAIYGWEVTSLGLIKGAPNTFATDGSTNRNFFSDPDVDALIDELVVEFDPARQTEILTEIDALVWGSFYGAPLYQNPTVTAFEQSKVTGISPSMLPPGLFWNVWEWAPATSSAN